VRDRAQATGQRRRRKPDAFTEQTLERLGDAQPERAHVDLHEVRLDLLEIGGHAGFVERLAEPAGPRMVLREALDVVVEGVDARGRDDSGLPHRAAELVLVPPCAKHPFRRAGDDRAERAAEPFREADRNGVGVTGDCRGTLAARDRGVEETRAVEVEGELELPAGLGDCRDLGEGPHPPARRVVRVLDRDDARGRRMAEITPTRRGAHLLGSEASGTGRQRARHQAGVYGRAAELGDQEVRVLFRDQLVARLGEHTQRDLVRHRRRGNEDGIVVAEQLGHTALELVDSGVLTQLLVAHLGGGNGLPHRGRRLRGGIGAEVDHDLIVAAQSTGVPAKLG